jgi:hypothetical protein
MNSCLYRHVIAKRIWIRCDSWSYTNICFLIYFFALAPQGALWQLVAIGRALRPVNKACGEPWFTLDIESPCDEINANEKH